MKPEERAAARKLRREQGLPMKVIAARLGVSPGSVHLWTRDIEISEEQQARNLANARAKFARHWSELNRERRREAQRKGRERARQNDPLHASGCMLYWAEGSKDKNAVCLSNSDLDLVAFFVRFLRVCFSLDDDRFTLRLNVYTTTDSHLGR